MTSAEVTGRRVKPVLLQTAVGYEDTEKLPHAVIAISERKLDLGRQLLIGATYVFEVGAVEAEGRVSAPARSAEFVNR